MMQVNVAGLRRNIKNLAHNYSDAQVKVREATSNDPWGPSSTLMSEIADLTYNVVAFTEIMQMIWKRLNDHGRNWRHVYKALVLLEYLIKTGTEKVAQQCKENIFAIQTLKDFQYFEENKDQGMNVREKAKQLVLLLKDDERLRNERARALKAKERFAQSASGFGSEGMDVMSPTSPSYPELQGQWSTSCESAENTSRELESARPQTVGEEELQLQLALAMSREEAEQEEQRRRSDDVRLQLALSQSEEEFKHGKPTDKQSHMLDLLDVSLSNATPSPPQPTSANNIDPWGLPQAAPALQSRPQADPWNSPVAVSSTVTITSPAVDPWAPTPSEPPPKPAVANDPWRASPVPPTKLASDPWSPSTDHSSPGGSQGGLSANTSPTNGDLDEFDIITNREKPQINNMNNVNNNGRTLSPDPFDFTSVSDSLSDTKPLKKTPQSFLGENSSLVNLDNLVTVSMKTVPGPTPEPILPTAQDDIISASAANPFAASQPNPFHSQQPPRPTINQIRRQQYNPEEAWSARPPSATAGIGQTGLPAPLLPSGTEALDAKPNPFLS